MVERYQFSVVSSIIRETLRDAFSTANPGEFQGQLRWLWTVKNGEWSEDDAVADARSKGSEPETTRQVFRYLRSFDKHDSGYAEWCIRVIPEACRSHFEVLRFGKRVDRRSKWGRLSNSEANAILSAARGSPKFPFKDRDTAQRIWDGDWGRKFPRPDGKWSECRQRIAEWFWRREVVEGVVGEKRPSIAQVWDFRQRPTRRSVSSKHNARRFGLWVLHSQSEPERDKQIAIWQRSHPEFRSAVRQQWGDEYTTIIGFLGGEQRDE